MKALRTAAFIVGGAALIATGIGAAIGTAGVLAGISGAAFATVGTYAGIAASLISIGATAFSNKAKLLGSATAFTIDKNSGIPVAFGRTYVAGRVAHRQYYGTKNSLESWVNILSLGPVHSLGPLQIDKTSVTFSGGAAIGAYSGFMWLDEQLGACPETRALAGPQGSFPGWGGTSKLSGLAADLWTLKFDDKGKKYPNGVPQRGRVVEGVLAWEPRQDSTYPGGSGACRLSDPKTHLYSENPWILALQWAFGFWQNGVLVAGGGLGVEGIDVASYVDAANWADSVGWKAGGVVFTDTDNSWDVLRMLAQAGGGEPVTTGGVLSCTFCSPKVSIGTITTNDICGDVDVPGTASRRLRRNTVIPKVRLETHGWEIVPLDALMVPAYVAVDGGTRPAEIEFPLVQQVDQGAQLGLYEIWNGRELDGIVLPSKVYAIGYRPGDCLTVNIPDAALARDVVVRNREIEGSNMTVTLTCRSETFAKHAFCLGKTGAAPPTPDLSVPPSYPLENTSSLQLAIATSFPIGLSITAAADGTITISNHIRRYTDGHADVNVTGTTIASGLVAGDFRAIGYDDSDRIGGAVTYVLDPDDINARASPDHPGRHYIGYAIIPTAGSPPSSGGGATPPGGRCPTTDTPILMADMTEKPAGDIVIGDRVWTRHEETLRWGFYPVEAVEIAYSDDVWKATIDGRALRATGDHRVYVGAWVMIRDLPGATRVASTLAIVKITVTDAHTYVSNGILSHNIKANEPTYE